MSEIINYNIQNQNFQLEINETVFAPSEHGIFFAENIKIYPGEKVIDIGTGSGFSSVLSAKLGAKVFATDINSDAIEITKKNAEFNQVKIETHLGSYFGNLNQKFDVILANLPQGIVISNDTDINLNLGVDGGKNGNEYILEFLNIAKDFMHSKSRLYMMFYTVSDYITSLQKTIQNYSSKLIAIDTRPAKEFVKLNEESDYKKLNESGKINIFQKNGKIYAHKFMFELSLN